MNLKSGLELYHLTDDRVESKDVASAHPEKVAELLKEAAAARAELGDALTKEKGTGTRVPGRLTDAEAAALEKIHWPEGRKEKGKTGEKRDGQSSGK